MKSFQPGDLIHLPQNTSLYQYLSDGTPTSVLRLQGPRLAVVCGDGKKDKTVEVLYDGEVWNTGIESCYNL